MATPRDRAIGALVGLAIGDAVGTTLEFKAPGTFTPIDDMVGGGPFGLAPGEWTDDTTMAMCLAESILDGGELDPADQLRRYLLWLDHGYWSVKDRCFDIGNTTVAALNRFRRDGSVVDAVVHEESAANGSLMRLAPVPIRWHRDVAEAAERSGESSRTTHAASRPVDACRAYGAMIAAVIGGATLEEALHPDFWSFGPLHPEIEAVVRGSWRTKEPPAIRGTGFVVHALEAALWAVGGAASYADAVLRAANLGDDADTTAAIAGQLAGAWWGVEGMPAKWVQQLARRDRIEAIAGRLYDAAVDAPHAEAWPHDECLHGYWLDPGVILAGEYPGNPDERLARERINLLADHGIRTWIDLTQRADGLNAYRHLVEEAAERRGLPLQHRAYPIPDMGVRPDEGYDEIVDAIRSAAREGGVYFHCWGGIGRTATVAGCLLVDSGMEPDAALAHIESLRSVTRKAHMAAPQTSEQRRVVARRARR